MNITTDQPLRSPELSGRRVRLRAVNLEDYQWVYELLNDPSVALRWRAQPGTINPQNLGQTIWTNVYCQFIIEARSDRRPLGLAAAYDPDLSNGHVHIMLALESGEIFISYLFAIAAFRKIYGTAIDTNLSQYESAFATVLHEEGRLRQHVYAAGSYHDHVIMAIYRDEFLESLAETRARRADAIRRATARTS